MKLEQIQRKVKNKQIKNVEYMKHELSQIKSKLNVSSPQHQKKIENIFSVREQLIEEKAEKIK